MIEEILENLVGKKLSDLYGVFFFEGEALCEKPLSLYFPDKKGNYIVLVANGSSKIELCKLFSDVYFAEEIGFTYVTSLMKMFCCKNINDSKILKAYVEKTDAMECIQIYTSSKDKITFKFEDDELMIITDKLEDSDQ